ncbi:MAG TPA: DUF4214 domain-containing protein [Telluria sp.]|nr:DUF4214 domain-containing protein [Telluria sp.]
MLKLILSTMLSVFLVCLSSCGGSQQSAQENRVGSAVAMRASARAGADYEELLQQIYIAYFGRPADPGGLAYHTQQFRLANAPTTVDGLLASYATNAALRAELDSFALSVESQQLYPSCAWVGCDYQWMFALYRGLFSREPDAGGAEFWVNALHGGGATRASVLLAVSAGARGADAELLARKMHAAVQFTRALDAADQRDDYSGQLPNAIMRGMIHNLASLADDAAVQAEIEATIRRIAALAAGTVDEVAPGSRKILLLASVERFSDSGARLSALAEAMAGDLNRLRPDATSWAVSVARAADSVAAVRAQLKGYDGVILVGRIPVATDAKGAPFLDVYRLPDCPDFQMDGAGTVLNALAAHSAAPRCQNGLVVSVLRGTSAQGEFAEVANKLDQMIAYHRASNTANARWIQRFLMVEAGWFGGPEFQWGDLSSKWLGNELFAANAISYANEGTAVQRRAAFLDCVGQNIEMCNLNVHGAPQFLAFEGAGIPGVFYSSDTVNWFATELSPQAVKAKYIDLASCSTQDFLPDYSIGTSLLMRGSALLTHGTTTVTGYSGAYQEDIIKNEYALLQNGATFADALYGRMEGSPLGVQGDPYITMRSAPAGARPKLLIDGKRYRDGVMTIPVIMADAVGGTSAVRVLSFSNRGQADLHLRIGSTFSVTGVDYGTARGGEYEFGYNAQYEMEYRQIFSDGSVLAYPDFVIEQNGGAMPVTLKPGQSVAITYRLSVRTGADGKPKRTGLYTGQLAVTSDDPDSARIYLAMQGRVR